MCALALAFVFVSAREHILCSWADRPCDSVVGRSGSGAAQSKMEAYVDSLMQELQHGGAGAMHSFQAGSNANLKTIFIGGGTPSLLQPAQVSRILDALEKRFGIAAGAEVSFVSCIVPLSKEMSYAFCLVLLSKGRTVNPSTCPCL